ncbi:MAG: hypothetical protein NBKEAIPA_01342 [Nitrospirae bacterium]|nr:MAG: hypothetical protein UZ03_NOB001001538 [Nitrospira sp. OLB3]MBV6469451.1 hypothetical protein [Nitrospirota bacterium]MCK6493689.1 DUF4268 domain-containing protein [Nitrospira sp.]MEB2337653.1 DUF4268 domain-containing protein [Nitrospirales bacterium]
MAGIRNLSKLMRVPLREAWKHEAGELTPWLAEADNLNTLADALGVSELVLVATEHWVGDFKLDILCSDGDQQVIIENQLDETDHKHLGQILSYAAGVGANKVVWLAESFRPEHIAALQFLNENTTENLSFFGVQIELWRIGESPLAPKFEVVVKPNDWAKIGREQARAVSSASPTKQLQQKFWTALVERLAKNAPHIRPQKPRPQHWLNNSIGRSGFGLTITANTRDERLGVELWIPGAEAKKHFADLLVQKQVIEGKLGFELDWQELPDAKACRIATWYSHASIEDESRWDEYLNWLTERLVKMDQVLRPIVKALP